MKTTEDNCHCHLRGHIQEHEMSCDHCTKPICDICQTEHKHKEIDEDRVKELADKISEESWEEKLKQDVEEAVEAGLFWSPLTGLLGGNIYRFIKTRVAKAHAEGVREGKEEILIWAEDQTNDLGLPTQSDLIAKLKDKGDKV